MDWRFLDTGARAGAYNMALDEAILHEVEAGRSPPTVRIYGWDPPCISLGHSQVPGRELDLVRAAALGFDVVARPTGGRAVLHIDELTYSAIAPPDAEPWCDNQASSYKVLSQAVAQALGEQGFGVTLDRGYPVERPQALKAMTPCFSSTARSEVVWGDRKVVGSAQRRFRGAYLQHGSILVSEGHRRLVDCLRLGEERKRDYLEILDRNAVSLEAIHGRRLDWRDLTKGFLSRMAMAMGVEYREGAVTERERELTEELMAERIRLKIED
ncbi:MAG TPA: lipoate--protein ligase family protein [Fibrobacteria bacterium]|nr:lipoate--protein ligase family protein [Fibrobacteria bacterium]